MGGQDYKNSTSVVPIEWIKRFNLEDFKFPSFDLSECHVIEWRKAKKEPTGEWHF